MNSIKGEDQEVKKEKRKNNTFKKKSALILNKETFNLDNFKEKMFAELKDSDIVKKEDFEYQKRQTYESLSRLFITEGGITHNSALFISKMISESNTLTKDELNNNPVHIILINIVKQLLLSDIELIYFSIFLERVGWTNPNFTFADHLFLTAFSVKLSVNEDVNFIINYFKRQEDHIFHKYDEWRKSVPFDELSNISHREVVAKFKLFCKAANIYCKGDYINYNYIVDQILFMSMAHSEQKDNGGSGIKDSLTMSESQVGTPIKVVKNKKNKQTTAPQAKAGKVETSGRKTRKKKDSSNNSNTNSTNQQNKPHTTAVIEKIDKQKDNLLGVAGLNSYKDEENNMLSGSLNNQNPNTQQSINNFFNISFNNQFNSNQPNLNNIRGSLGYSDRDHHDKPTSIFFNNPSPSPLFYDHGGIGESMLSQKSYFNPKQIIPISSSFSTKNKTMLQPTQTNPLNNFPSINQANKNTIGYSQEEEEEGGDNTHFFKKKKNQPKKIEMITYKTEKVESSNSPKKNPFELPPYISNFPCSQNDSVIMNLRKTRSQNSGINWSISDFKAEKTKTENDIVCSENFENIGEILTSKKRKR